MKKALFIGNKFGNGFLEYKTLKFFFNVVDIIEPGLLYKNKFLLKCFHIIGPKIFSYFIHNYVLSKVKKNYDLIYVRSGEYLSKELVLELKNKTKKIVYYCNDNPFVERDKKRWNLFLPASKLYDLLIFQDVSRIKPSKKLGLKNIFLTLPPYDSQVHKNKKSQATLKKNDVVFIGTWFPERGVFFRKLINLGLNVKIYGTRWDKDPDFEFLKSRVHLGHVANSRYTKIIQNSKIALAIFSDQNRDSITRRVSEITAIGTLLCSYKTKTMTKNFIENREVIYFRTAKECHRKCNYYLKNDKLSKKIALNGKYKTTKILKINNYEMIKKIINKVN